MKQKCDKCSKEVYKRPDDWDFWMKINKDADFFKGWAILALCKSCKAPEGFKIKN